MAEINKHQGLLNLTEKYLGSRANIQPVITDLRANPEILDRIVWQFDRVIYSVNGILEPRRQDCFFDDFERKLMPNIFKTRKSRITELPSLGSLEKDNSYSATKLAIQTFEEANWLMQNGEAGLDSKAWNFHKGITDTEDLTCAMMLELYGVFVRSLHPKFEHKGINPVVVLEEVLASSFPDTDLFIAAREWYTEEEGFSPELINHVAKIDPSKLKRRRPVIENPEYRIFEVSDPNAKISEDAKTVLLGAQNPEQLMTEVSLQRILGLIKSKRENTYLVHWEGSKVPQGIVLGGKEVAWTQNGVVQTDDGEIIGVYERIIENGGRYGDEQFMAFFLMPSELKGLGIFKRS